MFQSYFKKYDQAYHYETSPNLSSDVSHELLVCGPFHYLWPLPSHYTTITPDEKQLKNYSAKLAEIRHSICENCAKIACHPYMQYFKHYKHF